jgi:hypothetical protein
MMEQNYMLVFDNKECLIMDSLNKNAVAVLKNKFIEDTLLTPTLKKNLMMELSFSRITIIVSQSKTAMNNL